MAPVSRRLQPQPLGHRPGDRRLARAGRAVDGDDRRSAAVPPSRREVVEEGRVAGGHAGEPVDLGPGPAASAGHGGGHGHAVVAPAVASGPARGGRRATPWTPGRRRRPRPRPRRPGPGRPPPASRSRLLHPQLPHVPEDGRPLGGGGGHRQDGHLVEGGDLGRLDHGGPQRSRPGRCTVGRSPSVRRPSSTSAPMRRSTSTKPVRSGPGVDVVHRDLAARAPGSRRPPRRRPGTGRRARRGRGAGAGRRRRRTTRPAPSASTVMSAPASASISSVWARVATGSRTTVSPAADSPASRMADFTWALATGGGPVDAPQRPAGHRERRQAPLAPALHPGPHGPQRLGDPVHGPGRQRPVPDSTVVDPSSPATTPASSRMPGPRVAAVDRAGRRRAAVPPVDPDHRRPSSATVGPEGGHGRRGAGARRRRRTVPAPPSSPRPAPPAAGPGARSTCRPGVRTVPASGRSQPPPRRLPGGQAAMPGHVRSCTVAAVAAAGDGVAQPVRCRLRRPPARARRGGPRPSGRSRCRRC